MLSNRPATVKIGIHTWSVAYSEKSWKKYAADKMSDHIGLTSTKDCRILIKGYELVESMQKETFFHELMHACLASYIGFGDAPIETTSNYDTEEVMVRLISPALIQVLRENPKVMEWLLA